MAAMWQWLVQQVASQTLLAQQMMFFCCFLLVNLISHGLYFADYMKVCLSVQAALIALAAML